MALSPLLILPGVSLKSSHIDPHLPSSLVAPSIWNAADATPHAKLFPKLLALHVMKSSRSVGYLSNSLSECCLAMHFNRVFYFVSLKIPRTFIKGRTLLYHVSVGLLSLVE